MFTERFVSSLLHMLSSYTWGKVFEHSVKLKKTAIDIHVATCNKTIPIDR